MGLAWWQRGIVYQVYPRSFQDTGNDGVGDIKGVMQRLDHLVSLGVDALWLSPVYPSPMADFGYDVSNYCDIDPLFGTLADFDALLARAHALGLKLIVDFVPNHTSDQHPWFQDSASSRTSPHRDWYLWRDPAPGGGPPNNWLGNFAGPAWTLHPATGQYYYHSFLPQQPDLDWRNPAVIHAMHQVLRFWMDRGVDGVRVDVMWMMIKDDQFRDNPPNPAWTQDDPAQDRLLPLYTADRPDVHPVVAGMRTVLDTYGGRVMIGELYLPIPRMVAYYGPKLNEAQLPFNFRLLLDPWDPETIAQTIRDYEAALPPGAWPNWVLGNHDRPRIATRVGPAQARVAAVLLLTLRGTPTIYNGEEIGMQDVVIPPNQVRDPAELRQPGHGQGRDPQRTPMPWNATPGHGFTTGVPWLPFGDPALNVASQTNDPTSMLTLYRSLTTLRRTTPALAEGAIGDVHADGSVLSYVRQANGQRLHMLLNFGLTPARATTTGTLRLSTHDRHGPLPSETVLAPNEAIVVET